MQNDKPTTTNSIAKNRKKRKKIDFDEAFITKIVSELYTNGNILNTVRLFYDIRTNSYILLPHNVNSEEFTFEFINEQSARKIITQYFYTYIYINKILKPRQLLDSIPTVYSIFDPTKTSLIFTENNQKYLNLFIPTKYLIPPQEYNDKININDFVQYIKNNYIHIYILLLNLFTKDEYIAYFLNWLAYIVQTKKKTRTAIVLKGRQGTGKNLLYERILLPLFSQRYAYIYDNDGISSRFNDDISYKLLLVANEVKGNFQEGNARYEKLKAWITDNEIRVEGKYQKASKLKNYLNLIFFTNDDTPLQIQPNDRRYSVFHTAEQKLTDTVKDFFDCDIFTFISDLEKEKDNFLFDLWKIDIDYNMIIEPLENEYKQAIINSTNPKLFLLGQYIRTRNVKWFENIFEELKENIARENKNNEELTDILDEFDEKTATFLDQLENNNRIENSLLVYVYKLIVDELASYKKIGNDLNKILPRSTVSNGIRYRYISFTSEEDEFEDEDKDEIENTEENTNNDIEEDVKNTDTDTNTINNNTNQTTISNGVITIVERSEPTPPEKEKARPRNKNCNKCAPGDCKFFEEEQRYFCYFFHKWCDEIQEGRKS